MALVALAEEGDLSALVPFFKVSRPLKEAASATLSSTLAICKQMG